MARRKGSLSNTRFACYVYDASANAGPYYGGKRFGNRIAYREFAQEGAALRWLNASPRCALPRQLVRREYDPMTGCYMGRGGGQWYCLEQASL